MFSDILQCMLFYFLLFISVFATMQCMYVISFEILPVQVLTYLYIKWYTSDMQLHSRETFSVHDLIICPYCNFFYKILQVHDACIPTNSTIMQMFACKNIKKILLCNLKVFFRWLSLMYFYLLF